MLYLLLAIASSAVIAIFMRLSTGKVKASFSMLAVNYVTCMLLGLWYAGFQIFPPKEEVPAVVGMGVVNGVLYLLGFVLLQYNTRKNGVVLSSVFIRLGLLVPMVLSVFLFREIPTLGQGVGFLLAVGSILLINYEKGTAFTGNKWPLILMLLCSGSGDAMSKVFEMYGPSTGGDQFLFYIFASAFLLCLVLVVRNKECLDKNALLFGALLGIPNFFCTKFLLMALGRLPAMIVYPTFSVATILVVTLAGVYLFRERLQKRQWMALMIILAALVLLNI